MAQTFKDTWVGYLCVQFPSLVRFPFSRLLFAPRCSGIWFTSVALYSLTLWESVYSRLGLTCPSKDPHVKAYFSRWHCWETAESLRKRPQLEAARSLRTSHQRDCRALGSSSSISCSQVWGGQLWASSRRPKPTGSTNGSNCQNRTKRTTGFYKLGFLGYLI